MLAQISQHQPDIPFVIHDWSGESKQYGAGPPRFILRIHTPQALKSILRNADLGFGEAFMAGDIEVEGDLQALLAWQETPVFTQLDFSLAEKIRFVISTLLTRNTVEQVKNNVHHHYDLGNDFYQLWLDKSMTYTCAYFRHPDDSLDQAQWNKHDHICRKLRLQPGQTLVDVGCGWGAMLFHAAEHHDVIATGYTISQAQHDWLQAKIKERGMVGRVHVKLKDYREIDEQYDRFVSIGMAEQIGQKYIDTYFQAVKKMLKPDGVGLLHTIGAPIPVPTNPWMEKYIFPGGYIPSLGELVDSMGRFNLVPTDIEDLRLHYSQTIDCWYRRFDAHEAEIEAMYDQRFIRMWRLYLNSVAYAFRHGRGRLYQLAFTNGLNNDQPRTRAFIYDQKLEEAPLFTNDGYSYPPQMP
ncbi:MAG TPA: cyclopropane-fatty-acyl-phospholipid synthase family protein [Anaerolineae bacterium]|nr:cyclopropane-fatty-acyl-phospholipid synthase family protein [Anaerolineae bacterium]